MKTRPLGLTRYTPSHCYLGYTLFCNNFGGNSAYLIDMEEHSSIRGRDLDPDRYGNLNRLYAAG